MNYEEFKENLANDVKEQMESRMNDIKTEDREYAPFEMIHDNYPKYILLGMILYRKEMELSMLIFRNLCLRENYLFDV